jgi:hypothetical protein
VARIWQSVIFEDATGVQVSYYDEVERDERGMLIRTAIINPIDLKPEVEELFDSLTQLVDAWEGQRREVRVPRR